MVETARSLGIRPDSAVVVLTGAGISAESGIPTFRDMGGTWEQFDIQQVATPRGFHADPALVWRFYSDRRKHALACQPNDGHRAVAALERQLAHRGRFTLVTQNVDGLHPRAGSRRVLSVHGSLFRTKCSNPDCAGSRAPWDDEATYYDGPPPCDRCGAPLRPDVVWFEEYLDPAIEVAARQAIGDCDLFIAVGTSGVVYPVAGYVELAGMSGARTVLVNLEAPANLRRFDAFFQGKAAELLPVLLAMP